jgi:hypothetical protein
MIKEYVSIHLLLPTIIKEYVSMHPLLPTIIKEYVLLFWTEAGV